MTSAHDLNSERNNSNAVKAQVWIAISVYVLVAIVKRELRVDRPLIAILQFLSLTLFEKTPIFEALSINPAPTSECASTYVG